MQIDYLYTLRVFIMVTVVMCWPNKIYYIFFSDSFFDKNQLLHLERRNDLLSWQFIN